MPSNRYLDLDFSLDEEALAERAYTMLQDQFPGWSPADGNAETHIIEIAAMMAAERASVASLVPLSIFRYYGQILLGIVPIDGEYATVSSTWHAIDQDGHAIDAGTVVDIDGLPFSVVDQVVIDPGADTTAAGEVSLIALEVGEAYNGLGTAAALIDSLYWVDSVEIVGQTDGGTDPESEDEFMNRLTEELQLLTPRPILPNDFAVLAQRASTEIERAVGIDLYQPGTNEVQQLAVTGGTPVSGNANLTYSGQSTGLTVPYNATATQVQTALRALSNIGPEDVVCTGGPWPGTPILVEFTNLLGEGDRAAITAADTFSVGDVTITTPTAGVAAATNVERYVSVAVTDGNGEPVSDAAKTEAEEYIDGLREVNFIARIIDPTYTVVDVTVAVTRFESWDPAAVVDEVETLIEQYLDPAQFGRIFTGDEDRWYNTSEVNRLSLGEAIKRTQGVAFIDTLTINGSATDLALTGAAPLTRPGTITVTITNA